MNLLKIFCWNIANPSIKRAQLQFEWLIEKEFDVLVLTETKHSVGCDFLINMFTIYGYNVIRNSIPEGREYGVIIVSKLQIYESDFMKKISSIPSRVCSCIIEIDPVNKIELIGVYIPSRDVSEIKIERKKRFIENLINTFADHSINNLLFCGDFNILEPDHIPRYGIFQKWEYNFYSSLIDLKMTDVYRFLHPEKLEYSWIGRTNNGYRYDHSFISNDLIGKIESCIYLSEPVAKKLSDHSAIITTLKL